MGCREGLCHFSGQWVLVETYYWVVLDKNLKNPVSVFRVFDLLYIQLKPYESELSTALSECKAVTRSGHPENKYGDKQNKNRWSL